MTTNLLTIITLLFFIILIIMIFDIRVRRNIFYFQVESLLVVIFGVTYSIINSDVLILVTSMIALFSKVLIIPQALYILNKSSKRKKESSKEYAAGLHMLAISGLILFNYLITRNLVINMDINQATILVLGLSIFFLGFYIMIIKNNLIQQILGFVTLENAITLLSITFAPKLPIVVEIGLLLIILVAVAIMVSLSLSVNRMFKTFNTDKLTKLKD